MNASTPTASLPLIIAPRLRSPRGGLAVAGRDYRPGVFLPASARPILEALAARAAKVSVADPIEIGIHGYVYRVRSVTIALAVGSVAFLVIPKHKPGESYHVHHDNHGETHCTCPDSIYRRQGTGVDCKHGRALAALGLIPSTRPRVLPPFAQRSEVARAEPPTAPTPTYRNRFEPTPADVQAAAVALGWS